MGMQGAIETWLPARPRQRRARRAAKGHARGAVDGMLAGANLHSVTGTVNTRCHGATQTVIGFSRDGRGISAGRRRAQRLRPDRRCRGIVEDMNF